MAEGVTVREGRAGDTEALVALLAQLFALYRCQGPRHTAKQILDIALAVFHVFFLQHVQADGLRGQAGG